MKRIKIRKKGDKKMKCYLVLFTNGEVEEKIIVFAENMPLALKSFSEKCLEQISSWNDISLDISEINCVQ